MSKSRSWSLRSILILFALSIVVPAVAAVAGLIGWNAYESRHAREEQLLTVARSLSTSVDLRMATLSAAADAVATSELVTANDWPGVRRRIERLDLGSDVWVAITDRTGARLLNTGPVSETPPPIVLPRPASIQRALKSGQPEVSNLFRGASTGRWVVAVDRRVDQDPMLKVVTLVTTAEGLSRRLRTERAPAGAMVTLMDRRGQVISRTREQQRFVGHRGPPHLLRALERTDAGVVAGKSLDGKDTIAAFSRSQTTGWTTVVVLPRSEFTRPILTSAAGFVLATSLMLAFGVIGARVCGRMLSRELKALEEDAVVLGKGGNVAVRLGPIDLINTVQIALSYAGVELERRRRRQDLMLNELNHRVKNTLATVQGLSVQTFRHGDPEAPAKFEKRLAALAGAHDLLTQSEWTDVDIRDVVNRCGEYPGKQVRTKGPSIRLAAEAGFALCLCLHELVTNSLKYGALSVPDGEVLISWGWSGEDRVLNFEWVERGGPVVTPPERVGFGTRLMDRLCGAELGGKLDREFAPSGLIARGQFRLKTPTRWRNDFT